MTILLIDVIDIDIDIGRVVMTEAKFGLYKLSWPLLAMEWLCWAKMLGNF